MSITAFETLLNRRDNESEVPTGDFRSLVVDVVNYFKESRGSTIELKEPYVFDPLLPSLEEFFLVIAEVVSHWFGAFEGYQVFFVKNNIFSIDDGIYDIYPELTIIGSDIMPGGAIKETTSSGLASNKADGLIAVESKTYSPYFYELTRAVLPIDGEIADILELMSEGNYPRYQQYGAMIFLIDLIYWGWQTYLGEADGRGEGDISFVVKDYQGLDKLIFECYINLGTQTISLAQAVNINSGLNVITNFQILDSSTVQFDKLTGIEKYGVLPDTAIGIALGRIEDSLDITDIILKFQPPSNNYQCLVYSCNRNFAEMDLVVLKATTNKNGFVLGKQILNNEDVTGIALTATAKRSLVLLFKGQDSAQFNNKSLSYNLQIFSGAELIGQQYFTIGTKK